MSKLLNYAIITENEVFSADFPNSHVFILKENDIKEKRAFVDVYDDKVMVKNTEKPFNYFAIDTLTNLLQRFFPNKEIIINQK